VLHEDGSFATERVRIDTPVGSHPEAITALLAELVTPLPAFERVAVGFPGMVRNGVVRTAPEPRPRRLDVGFDLATALQERLGAPVRVANDADVQGLAVIQRQAASRW
jgi:polyphosphate glucokinase